MSELGNIEIIGLFVEEYLTPEQFTDIFFDRIDEFHITLGDNLFYCFIDTNFNSKEQYISIKSKLTNFLKENHPQVFDNINDSYVEKIVAENNDDIVTRILAEKYISKELAVIECSGINSAKELIIRVRDSLGFPLSCTNWDAIYDMIYDVLYPKKIIFLNSSTAKNIFAKEFRIIEDILDRANSIGGNNFTVEYR